jgi:glutaconate CoA-transferase subunit B
VISDYGILRPAPDSCELQLTAIYPGVSVAAVRAATGWPLQVADTLERVPPPQPAELNCLRELQARTRVAHAHPVRIRVS